MPAAGDGAQSGTARVRGASRRRKRNNRNKFVRFCGKSCARRRPVRVAGFALRVLDGAGRDRRGFIAPPAFGRLALREPPALHAAPGESSMRDPRSDASMLMLMRSRASPRAMRGARQRRHMARPGSGRVAVEHRKSPDRAPATRSSAVPAAAHAVSRFRRPPRETGSAADDRCRIRTTRPLPDGPSSGARSRAAAAASTRRSARRAGRSAPARSRAIR